MYIRFLIGKLINQVFRNTYPQVQVLRTSIQMKICFDFDEKQILIGF